jgi:hypothetical protein
LDEARPLWGSAALLGALSLGAALGVFEATSLLGAWPQRGGVFDTLFMLQDEA